MRFTRKRRNLDQGGVNLASMIDVTFLLLIYFMVSTILAPDERSLDAAIRQEREEGASPDARDFRPQRITVVAEGGGGWIIGSRTIRERSVLEEVVANLPVEAGMVIEVQDDVPVDFAVAAVQVSRDAGFEEVAYVPRGD